MAVNALRDGFVKLCFDPSLNVYQGTCRILLEGQFYNPAQGCTITPDKPLRIASPRQIDCQFGAGSVLAESLKVAFGCCGNGANEIWALPRADAASSVKAAYTMTITGPATSDGRFDVYWGNGAYNISVRVTSGMPATHIAAAILAAIPVNFPYVGTVAAGVLTLTAHNSGTVGNFLNPSVNWHNRLNYFPDGVAVTIAQTVVGSVDPVALNYSAVLGECCYCCVAALYGNNAWQDGMIAYMDSAWSCDKPQCFGHVYSYSPGSLGQVLSQFRDKATVSLMAYCLTDPSFPWLKVAAYAAKSCCATVDNPELSIQGPNFGVLDCLKFPESCFTCFSYDEQVQLRDNAFVVTVPLIGGQGSLTSPEVTNDVTNNLYDDEERPNATFRDVSARRIAAETATALATELQRFNGLGLYTKRTDIRPGVKGTNPRLMLGSIRTWAKSQVGTLFSEFENIDGDIALQTDFEVAPECQGVPGLMHLNMVYRPPVRVSQILTTLQPRLLDNCN